MTDLDFWSRIATVAFAWLIVFAVVSPLVSPLVSRRGKR